jgi:hypothetical protein
MNTLPKVKGPSPAREERELAKHWMDLLRRFGNDWKKELKTGKWKPDKLRSELVRQRISPEGIHLDKSSCQEGWDRYCPDDEELKDFLREVAQCKAWMRLHLDEFEPHDKDDASLSSFASYWRCRIEAHGHESISVGAVIAAALSLNLIVRRDGWGCFLDNGYFDANLYSQPVTDKAKAISKVARKAPNTSIRKVVRKAGEIIRNTA